MQGKRKSFTISGVTLTLARPTVGEFRILEPRLEQLLYSTEVSEYDGMDEVLAQAVEHESETDKAAFDKLADIKDRTLLWDAWKEHSECEYFFGQRRAQKLASITRLRKEEYKAAGLTQDESDELLGLTTPTPNYTSVISPTE